MQSMYYEEKNNRHLNLFPPNLREYIDGKVAFFLKGSLYLRQHRPDFKNATLRMPHIFFHKMLSM